MTIKKLKKLEKSIRSAAESFRGVDMGAYTHLINAAEMTKNAVEAAVAFKKKPKLQSIPLNTLLYGQP